MIEWKPLNGMGLVHLYSSSITLTEKELAIIGMIEEMSPQTLVEIKICDDEIPFYSAAQCHIDNATGNVILKFRSDGTNECTVTHELLHVYFMLRGYVNQNTLDYVNNETKLFASRLDDIIIHKMIVKEQEKLGIEIKERLRADAETLNQLPEESGVFKDDFFFALLILETHYQSDGEFRSLYMNQIAKHNKNSMNIADRLLNIFYGGDSTSPFGARRILLRAFRETERVSKGYGVDLYLDTVICVPMVIRAFQFDQIASSVLGFNENSITVSENEKYSNFFLHSDKQCCGLIRSVANDDIKENIDRQLLSEFISTYKIMYGLRE